MTTNTDVIHVCRPRFDASWTRRARCPTCRARRTFFCEHAPWYGVTETCLGCGEAWGNGEMLEREFRPRWRALRVEQARQSMRELRAQGLLLSRKRAWEVILANLREEMTVEAE